jgi:hypothetical protein
MTHPQKLALRVVTRRKALGVCSALSVAGLASSGGFGRILGPTCEPELDSSGADRRTDIHLYAFRAPGTQRVVVAVTAALGLPGRFSARPPVETRFHIGEQMLTVPTAREMTSDGPRSHGGSRTFNGPVVMRIGAEPLVLHAALLELPLDTLKLNNIWAEQVTSGDRRYRVASPFLATLIAESASLARAYNAGSPQTDSIALREPVASTIARMAERWNYPGDASAYGQRLARTILPDVLSYDPQLPQGFTFAARNGRHPDDADFAVAHSMLTGTPASGNMIRRTANLQPSFPYFQPAST